MVVVAESVAGYAEAGQGDDDHSAVGVGCINVAIAPTIRNEQILSLLPVSDAQIVF